MARFSDDLKSLVIELSTINAVKFGEFKTKIGLMTPVYFDLRTIVSYPHLMELVSKLILERCKQIKTFKILCGVPYTALPIATVVSIKSGLPMVMRRKEAKEYGTKKLIEGNFSEGDECLIIEDVVTSGSSVLETVKDLNNAGIKCNDVIVLLDREQGGERFLSQNGIRMHSLLKLTELMEILHEAKRVDDAMVAKVRDYIASTQVNVEDLKPKATESRLELTFESRGNLAKNKLASDLFKIMARKQTNLCVAADVTETTDLLNLAEQVGPHICCLKTHIDIIEDFHPNFLKHLQGIAANHDFVLFEDRKFADIGQTVKLQYSKGIFGISSWAPLVTAHSLFGKGVLDAIKGCDAKVEKGVFLLAEASAADCLIDENYTKQSIKLADSYPDLVTGVVCQSPRFLDKPWLIQLTPGVQLTQTKDDLGQQYNTPEVIMLQKGCDIAVVGRGITQAADPAVAAEKYKTLLWQAYKKRIAKNK